MKRSLAITSGILSIACATCFGQGYIAFSNSGDFTDAPVTYDESTGMGGVSVGDGFSAGLQYQIGDGPLIWAPLSVPFGGGEGTLAGAYFDGGTLMIPGYVSGPISFIVVGFNGADYESSLIRGASTLFTLPSISTSSETPTEFGPALGAFTVSIVPEPSALAFAALGLAALMAARRRA